MAGTLIVRDATLAINGAPEARTEPETFLHERVLEAANLDHETIEDCVEVLLASASGEDPDPEVLEALTILGLSQPRISAPLGVSAVAHGRRLAARLERDGEVDHAIAVLEILGEHHPGHRALERDLAALMRRTGMVSNLIERYVDRAQALLKEGRTQEAIAWYREVMLLDRSRKDIARKIRDLRYQEIDEKKNKKRRRRIAVGVLVVTVVLSLGFLHEKGVYDAFQRLAGCREGDLTSMRARLDALESFVDDHPVWHGSLGVLAERSRLRVEIEHLEDEVRLQEDAVRDEMARKIEAADLARKRAWLLARADDYEGALHELGSALELAPPDWAHRERVERDVASIEKYLEEEE